MSALIEKERAIERARATVNEWRAEIQDGSYKAGFTLGANVVINTIVDATPSAEKTGCWIEEPNCMFRCSVCGEHYPSIIGYMRYRFCPNCGARMVKE